MGACSIVITAKGKNIHEAFKRAQAEAEAEHGRDPYNGEINNCSFIRDLSSKRPVMHPDELVNYCLEKTSKREVMGWCESPPKGNENKIKTSVEKFPQQGSRQWKTVYVGKNVWTGEEAVRADTQTECITKARAYVEKNPDERLEIYVTKELVKGNGIAAIIRYKKAAGEKEGTYTFAGWAPV